MTDEANPALSSHSTRDDTSASLLRAQPSPSGGSDRPVLGSDASSLSNPGIAKIHSANASWGNNGVWALLVLQLLGSLIFISSLESLTTPQFAFTAMLSIGDRFRDMTIPTSVYITSSVLAAILPIYYAKLSDRVGRAEGLGVAFLLYILGLILMGGASHGTQISAGFVFRYLGYGGIAVLPFILLADITTLRFRGLALSLTPFLSFIDTFIYLPMVNGLLANPRSSWRMGFFVFVIILPFLVLPIVTIIATAQRQGPKGKLASPSARFAGRFSELDLVGLLILTASVTFIIVATYLGSTSYNQYANISWRSPEVIVLLVLGILLFPVFVLYELRWKKSPVAYCRIFHSKIILAILAVVFFQQLAVSTSIDHQFMTFFVARPVEEFYSTLNASYLRDAMKMTRYGAAVAAGVVMALTRKSSKWLLVAALVVQLVGVAITIRTGGASGIAEFVVLQVIQGIGAGLSYLVILVSAQASVIHADVASVTAFVLLSGALGTWFGSALGSGVWYQDCLKILSSQFPNVSRDDLVDEIRSWSFGNRYPGNDSLSNALLVSFETVSKRLCIISTCLLLIPIALAFFFVQTIELGNTQNAVDHQLLDGKTVEEREEQV